jgi:DNA polymerase family B
MIISPQIGLHENVVTLDFDSEYAYLIVNHNLSYEIVTLEEGGKRIVVQQHQQQSNKKERILLPTMVERFLKRLQTDKCIIGYKVIKPSITETVLDHGLATWILFITILTTGSLKIMYIIRQDDR